MEKEDRAHAHLKVGANETQEKQRTSSAFEAGEAYHLCDRSGMSVRGNHFASLISPEERGRKSCWGGGLCAEYARKRKRFHSA